MISLDIHQIQEIIPQRFPMLMIDKIINLEIKKRVVGVKNISINEHFFKGHFPHEPVMPGVLIIEAMAQTATFLFYDTENPTVKLNFLLGVVKDVRFLKAVYPGHELNIVAEPIRLSQDSAYVKVAAFVEEEKVSEGELIFVRNKNKSLAENGK